jgi:periplasmic protein TonB
MSNESKSNIDDLVFAHRNKVYGAYDLRQLYSRRMTWGTLAGIATFLLLIFGPIIYSWAKERLTREDEILNVKEVNLAEPPPIDPNKPEPPPPPKVDPPPIKDQIKFVPPVVKKDEEVVEEEIPPVVEEVKKADISTETKEGKEDGVDASLVEPEVKEEIKEAIKEEVEEVFNTANVQQKPMFPDGDAALAKYLAENIKYPAVAKDNGIKGKVILRFTVAKSGNIENVELVRGIGGGCDQEAMRVVKGMPNWSPGKNNGKPVKVTFTLPVTFTLAE